MLQGNLDNFDPEEPAEGMYPSMSEEVYRGATAWNWSTLRYGVDTMSKVKWAADHPDEIEDTDDKLLGRCFDIVHLQPEQVSDRIIVPPLTYPKEDTSGKGDKKVTKIKDKPWSNNAKYCRAWNEKQREAGKEIIRAKDLKRAKAMAESLNSVQGVRDMIDGALIQVPIFWRDGEAPDVNKGTTGLICKAKLDVYKNGIVGDDKKVAKSAAWESFSGHVLAYRIYAQMAFYLDGVNSLLKLSGQERPKTQFVRLMVVEDHAPYDAAVYDLHDNVNSGSHLWLQAGREKWHGILQQVAHCLKTGKWPGHNSENPESVTEAVPLEPPEWAVKRLGITSTKMGRSA